MLVIAIVNTVVMGFYTMLFAVYGFETRAEQRIASKVSFFVGYLCCILPRLIVLWVARCRCHQNTLRWLQMWTYFATHIIFALHIIANIFVYAAYSDRRYDAAYNRAVLNLCVFFAFLLVDGSILCLVVSYANLGEMKTKLWEVAA